MTLGLVVIAALAQLYRGSAKSHQVTYTMARVGEDGRFAVDLLSSELRMAGYLSCGGGYASVASTLDTTDSWLYRTSGIEGYEYGASDIPNELDGEMRPGTDLLILRHASVDPERSVVADNPANAVIELGLDHGFQSGEVVVISNPSCTQSSIFQVTGLRNLSNPQAPSQFDAIEHNTTSPVNPGNCSASLFGSFDCDSPGAARSGAFQPGSVVSRFLVTAYYVTGDDPPWLARKRLGMENGEATVITERLVRNVEDLQLLYGRDTNNDGAHIVDDYVTADQVTDWSQVVSVNFGLLVRSSDGGVRTEATPQDFALPGKDIVTPGDRYLRRAFGNVIAIRNTLP